MSIKHGNIEIFMGPKQIGGPDDLEEVIVDFIDGAERKLDIAVQELQSMTITEAIIRARQRKVTVSVVLEADYLSVTRARPDPFDLNSQAENEENRQLHDAILRANVKVRTDFNTNIFHQKFVVRDRKDLLTGSTNFTPTGVGTNLNHIVIVKDPDVARTYSREFREISQGRFGKRNEGHDPVPPTIKVSDVPVKVLFAPDHAPEMEIMKQIAKAKERVDFAIFTFSGNSSGIDDQMILARGAGMEVRGVMDSRQANQVWAATRPLAENGVELHILKRGSRARKLHHKLMVIDKQLIIAGSFNYTGPANNLNDENIIILGDLGTENARTKAAQQKLAAFALEEIERIIREEAVEIEAPQAPGG
jgi:phosphatidylserine/phosphatidylglycerophosphate/cardiolipin synthase-like enzyme